MIYICFPYADGVPRVLGSVGTDILVRLTAFILFCLGVQIIWTGASELLGTIIVQRATVAMPPVVTADDLLRSMVAVSVSGRTNTPSERRPLV
jgi:hypothetical protein